MLALDFEQQIHSLEKKIEELRHAASSEEVNIIEEISTIQAKVDKLLKQKYSNLSPWEKVQVARHPERPHALDYIKDMIEDFVELSGDRNFAEDAAIIGGFGKFTGIPVMVIGQEKGSDTESRMKHNFGMPKPEGYRKAQRLMLLAEKYDIPVITFVDTAGAYPGVGAEERGQSEAIARSIDVCLGLKVPIISIVIGEGGSGGAIAIATANSVLMLEHSVYSVISPEGCASILWRSTDKKKDAAEALKMTAQDLQKLKIIDDIIAEPLGGAHRQHKETFANVKSAIQKELTKLRKLNATAITIQRRKKFLDMGRNL
jgi:acetyl-CoA carboxylase carboxyl transferase subunit alpha